MLRDSPAPEPHEPVAVMLCLAGEPALRGTGSKHVPLNQRDAALLAWLAIEGPATRARLAALLWPESTPDSARNSLRQRIFQLRKLAGKDVVVGSVSLSLANDATHDLHDADALLGNRPDEIGGEFGLWLAHQRERRRQRTRQALLELGGRAEAMKDYADALTHARELLALDPLSEEAHRRLIRLHYLAGDRAAALLGFDRCERLLKDEVGTAPSAETLALLHTIEQGVAVAGQLPVAQQAPASVSRPPRLIGRDTERAMLAQGLKAGHVVALIGEAGMGKTRLLQECMAEQPGLVRAAGRPGDAGVPLATLARLLRAVMAADTEGCIAQLPAVTRHELNRVLPEFEPEGPRAAGEGQRLVLQRAIRALLASRPSLVGLLVDDLHFADDASVEMLGALINDEGDLAGRLRWVLAYRPAEAGSPVQGLHDGIVDQARLWPVALAPLSRAALAELVDSLGLPGVNGGALVEGLMQRTGGNPLFVLETLKQAWVENTLGDLAEAGHLPKPLSVGRLIERRIAQLSPAALALARVASIAGVDFCIELAEAVLGVSAMQFADALNELESAQVLRDTQFAHDLVFDAVRQSVPAAIARHSHARVAEWLEAHDGEPARVAQHWVDAGKGTRALPWLLRAAGAAKLALRSKEFIAFMEHKSAIEEATGDRAAAFDSLLAATEESVMVDRDGAVLEAHCERLERLAATPAQRVETRLQRGHAYLQRGLVEEALAFDRAALQDSLSTGDAALVARVRRHLGATFTSAGREAEALVELQACVGWFDGHDEAAGRGVLHGEIARLYDNLGRLDEALVHHRLSMDIFRGSGAISTLPVAYGNLACNRLDAGDLSAADLALQQSQQIELAHDEFDGSSGSTQFMRALTLCHLGRYTEALAHAERSIESMQRNQPGHAARARLRLAHCWWHLGQWARVGSILSSHQPDAQASVPERLAHARLTWSYALATRAAPAELEAARSELRARVANVPEGSRPDLILPLRVDLAGEMQDRDEALGELAAVQQAARNIGHLGTALAAHIRAADLAADHHPAQARTDALAALQLADEDRQNTFLLPAELWLHAARALMAAGDEKRATQVLQQGDEWVRSTARDHVPAAFRDGFLERNPVNRALLALWARWAA